MTPIAATQVAAIQAEPIVIPVSPVFEGVVTHYGVQYNGSRMGCYGEPYSSEDTTIIAVGLMHQGEWPCGTPLRVCGVIGCVVGSRQDTCPGCGSYHLDLSEAGITAVCGDQADVCRVGIEQVLIELPPPEVPPAVVEVIYYPPPPILELPSPISEPPAPVLILNAGLVPVS